MKNDYSRTWNMARKLTLMENEKHPLDDLKKWQNHWKTWKMRNAHCRTWNMARKLKITENEKHPLDDLINDEITEKREKWEMPTEETGIWRENWKSQKMRNTQFRTWNMARKKEKVENLEMSTLGRGIWQENWKSWKWETSTWRLEKWRNPWKTWKMWNAHRRTWNMARKLKITENEKYTL